MTDLIRSHGYSDGDTDTNDMPGETLWEMVDQRHSRRTVMRGALGASAMAFAGGAALAGCSDSSALDTGPSTVKPGSEISVTTGQAVVLDTSESSQWTQVEGPEVELLQEDDGRLSFIAPSVNNIVTLVFQLVGGLLARIKVGPARLTFPAVAKNRNDIVTVPEGYRVTVMTRLGDPIAAGVSAYANDGTDTGFDKRIGDHGDALYFYGINNNGQRAQRNSKRGLLVQNHENLNVQYLHPNGPTNAASGPRPEAEAIKEIEAHGVSVTEYRDSGQRNWSWVQDSAFNRRITPNTPVQFNGPVRAFEFPQDRLFGRRHRRARHDQQLRQRPHALGHQSDLRRELGGLFPAQRGRRAAQRA